MITWLNPASLVLGLIALKIPIYIDKGAKEN